MNLIMSRAIQHQYPHRLPPPSTPSSPLDFTERIPFKELELSNETLGSGSFGTVFKGRWRGRNVAVKQFKSREEIDSFLIEVKQLSCVKHPNIVILYGASTLSYSAYLIMEYAEGGSLNHLLHECKQQQYDLRHACSWALQTARGVAYLHGIRPKPIMHRDLKPANLLLFSRGKILKICDFGTACTVKTQMTNNTGSASYMAPEVFATSSYLESGDVFSWSIIFWEILARRHPYSQYSNPYQILWRVKQEGARPNEFENSPTMIWSLITRAWHKDPRERPKMREVANEMEFIYSMTENLISPTTNNITSSQFKFPNRQVQICSPDLDLEVNSQLSRQQAISPMKVNNLQDTSEDDHSSTVNRELYTHTRALLHKLHLLRKRAEELQNWSGCDNKNRSDLFAEYEELKRETKLKKKEFEEKKRQFDTFNRQCFKPNT